jgi:UDP-N-acetylglucosamine acyltransferase
MGSETLIHATAVVDPGAAIEDGVEIGPYAVIGPNVQIGAGTKIHPHAVIDGNTTIGARCEIFPGAAIGLRCQDLKYGVRDDQLEHGRRGRDRRGAALPDHGLRAHRTQLCARRRRHHGERGVAGRPHHD